MKKQKFLKSFLSVLIVTILVLGTTACSPKNLSLITIRGTVHKLKKQIQNQKKQNTH